jgi:transcriptional regulator with XRE-family HTH domain
MPAPKQPTTFDAHLGSLIADTARRKGGRPFIAKLIGVSVKTVDRRALGDGSYSVKELNIIADALNTTPLALAEQALKNYADGSVEEGMEKLIRLEGPQVVSEPPASLENHRQKKTPPLGKRPSEMTEEELDAFEGEQAANRDPELGYDEPELP